MNRRIAEIGCTADRRRDGSVFRHRLCSLTVALGVGFSGQLRVACGLRILPDLFRICRCKLLMSLRISGPT